MAGLIRLSDWPTLLNIKGMLTDWRNRKVININIYCPPKNHAGVSATGKIRPNIKFGAFWCVFLTKKKVDPENW